MNTKLERDPQQMAWGSLAFPVNVAETALAKQADL
jgi:hypothetical protein